MEPRLQIRYPRTWTETMEILNNLEYRLNKLNESKSTDKHRRAKNWIQIVQEINIFRSMAERKVKESKDNLELLKKQTGCSKIIKANFELNFHQRNLRAIEAWISLKRVPKTS